MYLRNFLILSCLVFLSSCGGGGGGGGDNDGLNVSHSEINFSADIGGSSPLIETIIVSVSGYDGTVYFGMYYTDNGLREASYDFVGDNIEIYLFPRSPSSLDPGVYNDEVAIYACKDENCNEQIDGSPYTVKIQYTVGDGIGNGSDLDEDDDGVIDTEDAFPFDPAEQVDTDNDGIGNNADTDDDNDGVADAQDELPLNPGEQFDTDKDGIGNNADLDDDNDGVVDTEDAFPFNPSEQIDTDKDGIGNNADTDDDNDGVVDSLDVFPLDSTESGDIDGDGIGDNSDPDIDGDSFANETETEEGSDPNDPDSMPSRFELSDVIIELDDGFSASDLSKEFVIDTNNGAKINWSANSDAGWISLSNSSGDMNVDDSFTITIDLEMMLNEEKDEYQGTINISTDEQFVPDVEVGVFVSIGDHSRIHFTTPYVIYQKDIGNDYMILRGKGFSDFSGNIMVGEQTAASVEVISDTELHVFPPVLENGKYRIHLDGEYASSFSNADLIVKTKPAFADQNIKISRDHIPGHDRIFDPERNMFFTWYCIQDPYCDANDWRFYQFQYNTETSSWSYKQYDFGMGRAGVAITPDGESLVFNFGNQLIFMNPETMESQKVVSVPGGDTGDYKNIVVMNNGKVLVQGANTVYDNVNNSFTKLDGFSSLGETRFQVTGDKSKAMFSFYVSGTPRKYNIKYYDASTDTIVVSDFSALWYINTGISWDYRGNNLYYSGEILNKDFEFVGGVKESSQVSISPDGSKLVIYDQDNRYSVYDISGLSPYEQIASYSLGDYGGMIFGADNQTIFFSTYGGLHVRTIK